MSNFTDFILNEAYAPITDLVNTEENKEVLMRLGVRDDSTIEEIDTADARKNKKDLIIFTNRKLTISDGRITFTKLKKDEKNLFNVDMMKDKKETKARKKLAEKKYISLIIGYKKGTDYDIFRPKEAGEKKGIYCKKGNITKEEAMDCLYNSKYAYLVTISSKVEALSKFRKEHPERKEWLSTRDSLIVSKSPEFSQKIFKVKLIKLLEKAINYNNNKIIEAFNDGVLKNLNIKNIDKLSGDFSYRVDKSISEIKDYIGYVSSLSKKEIPKVLTDKYINTTITKLIEKYPYLGGK